MEMCRTPRTRRTLSATGIDYLNVYPAGLLPKMLLRMVDELR